LCALAWGRPPDSPTQSELKPDMACNIKGID
jgi:hypothetical protein